MSETSAVGAPSASSSARGASVAFIFVTILLDMLALGLIMPILPKLVESFVDNDTARAARIFGVFGTAWALMQFFFSPILGSLSDRFGRRPVVLLSNFGLGLDYVLMALAPSLAWLFVGRVISGITAASIPTANAYIADVTPEEKRAAKFGMLGAAFGLGFIIGPAVGGFLGGYGLRYPFWASAILSLANGLYGLFILPESLPKERRSTFSVKRANPLGALKLLRSTPELAGLAVAMFLYYNAHESLPSMYVLYTDYRYHFTAQLTGYAFTGVGVGSTIVSAFLISLAIKKLGETRTLYTGWLCGLAGFGVLAAAPTTATSLISIPLLSLWGLGSPAMNSLMTKGVDKSQQGQLQGALMSMFGVAGMIAPLVFTQVFSVAISPKWGFHLPGAPYWLAALLMLGSIGIASSVLRRATVGVAAAQPE